MIEINSGATEIETKGDKIKKTYYFNSQREAMIAREGYEDILREFPENVCSYIELQLEERFLTVVQPKISPDKDVYSGSYYFLAELALLVLRQQKQLVGRGMSFLDARPSNYIFTQMNHYLVDVGSISSLNEYSVKSFERDFRRHFVDALVSSYYLGMTVSSYLRSNAHIDFWNWGIRALRLPGYVGLVLRDDVEKWGWSLYLRYATSCDLKRMLDRGMIEGIEVEPKAYSRKRALRRNKAWRRLIDKLKEPRKGVSICPNYGRFHTDAYVRSKLDLVRNALDELPSDVKLMDLGSNHQVLESLNIWGCIDCDENVIRDHEARRTSVVSYYGDIVQLLRSDRGGESSILDGHGICDGALMLSIVHHICITGGVSPSELYNTLWHYFRWIVLELPDENDTMVRLLKLNKREVNDWSSENHLRIATAHYNVNYLGDSSMTRKVY